MSEETKSEGLEVKDLSSTSFGYVIGFLLPGLFGLYGLSMWSKSVRGLLEPATSTSATIGPSLFLLLSALTSGLLISALRYFVFERLVCQRHHLPKDMFAQLGIGDRLTAFKSVVDEHYRYHQFYGGCAVALTILFPKWLWDARQQFSDLQIGLLIAAFVGFEVLLGVTAYDAFVRYVQRGTTIAGSESVSKAREATCLTAG
jgi:hypothetical protein